MENYLMPVWLGDRVFAESVMFFPDPIEKQVKPAPLLFPAKEIISVTSSDFMIEYRENEDYFLENGKLLRAPGSRIPVWDFDKYYLPQPAEVPIGSASVPRRYVCFAPGGRYHKMQVAVTYRHCSAQKLQPLPPTGALPRTRRRLQEGKALQIVFFGDSIMAGCDASGHCNCPPYMPAFPELFTQGLNRVYPQAMLKSVNTAVGGTNTRWGVEQTLERVAAYSPDLVILNFGMNDPGGQISPQEFGENLKTMIAQTRKESPLAEFLLLSPWAPNPDCIGWTGCVREYRPAADKLAQDIPGVQICHIGELLDEIVRRKRYGDISGNGVNHPNDFLCRVYAQLMIKDLAPDAHYQ